MKYDDSKWHVDSVDSDDDDEREELAATHIGIYLKWCLRRGWAGEPLDEETSAAIQAVRDGAMSGTEYALAFWGGALLDEALSEEANAFTRFYYGAGRGNATSDATFRPEDACDFDAIAAALDADYDKWVVVGRPAPRVKPWWQFW